MDLCCSLSARRCDILQHAVPWEARSPQNTNGGRGPIIIADMQTHLNTLPPVVPKATPCSQDMADMDDTDSRKTETQETSGPEATLSKGESDFAATFPEGGFRGWATVAGACVPSSCCINERPILLIPGIIFSDSLFNFVVSGP